jgi:hypothetical protein
MDCLDEVATKSRANGRKLLQVDEELDLCEYVPGGSVIRGEKLKLGGEAFTLHGISSPKALTYNNDVLLNYHTFIDVSQFTGWIQDVDKESKYSVYIL